jgi:hypothetical protein
VPPQQALRNNGLTQLPNYMRLSNMLPPTALHRAR